LQLKTIFICENCGNEVPYNAEICPFCAKVFNAVRCPHCHFEGNAELFPRGCPKCGYLKPKIKGFKENQKKELNKDTVKKPKRVIKKRERITTLSIILGLIIVLIIFILYILFLRFSF
jgi:uncharacterized membrane protein YvbJ